MNDKMKQEDNIVSIIMGSQSDWDVMESAAQILTQLKIAHEVKVVSAHRTPDRMYQYAKNINNTKIRVIIAGAGGAAHLPGMVASLTQIPVLGVPVTSKALKGMDSLLSIVQMPGGVPVGTFAIGKSGAKNAALFAAAIIGLNDKKIADNLSVYRKNQADSVPVIPT